MFSAKLSMSPKASTNQRKKSSGFTEADRRLARAQQLMDGDVERPAAAVSPTSTSTSPNPSPQQSARPGKREEKRRDSDERERIGKRLSQGIVHPPYFSFSEPVRQKPQPVPVAPVQQSVTATTTPTTAPADPPSANTPTAPSYSFATAYPSSAVSTGTTSMPTSRPSVIPISAVHPTIYPGAVSGTEPIPIPMMLPVIPTLIPGLSLPLGGMDMTSMSLGALAEYYGQISAYDDSNLPATPTPSLASSVGTDRTVSLPRSWRC